MIEVRKLKKGKKNNGLFINSKRVVDVIVMENEVSEENSNRGYLIKVQSLQSRHLLLSRKVSEYLVSKIQTIDFGEVRLFNFENLPIFYKKSHLSGQHVFLHFGREVFMNINTNLSADTLDLSRWNKTFTLESFKQEFFRQCKGLGRTAFSDKESDYISIKINESEDILDQVFKRNSIILTQLSDNAIEILEQKASGRTSIKEFDFPPEVRVACEQYLQHFADFLKEVGVSAIANIEHDKAGKTLFSVKPDNPKIALENMREALEIYLELPMSPLVDDSEMTDSRMLVLRAEINTLKARLDFAQLRQLETGKRAELQRELIDAQKEILSGKNNQIQTLQKYKPQHFEPSIVYESAIETNFVDAEIVEETNPEKITETSNKEIDLGLVTVKPAKIGLGVEANTPRLTRLGIKKGKELFDYLDKKFNSEEGK